MLVINYNAEIQLAFHNTTICLHDAGNTESAHLSGKNSPAQNAYLSQNGYLNSKNKPLFELNISTRIGSDLNKTVSQ